MDPHRWLPYHNLVYLEEISGGNLTKILERGMTGLDPSAFGEPNWGQFFQISSKMVNSLAIKTHRINAL